MKHITKSKFKIALDCPPKRDYTEHKEKYANGKLDDFTKILRKHLIYSAKSIKPEPI